MSREIYTFEAPAKTNLWLKVGEKRQDGFHSIDTRIVSLSLKDTLQINWTKKDQVKLTCTDPSLPTGEENLVVKAVRVLENHLHRKFGIAIHLEKNIPSGAGLGGGSSDAATTLKAINQMGNFGLETHELARLGASIGSDIPFFIFDTPCDVNGRGEIVLPLENDVVPRLPVFLMKPAFGISAAWAYQNLKKARSMNLETETPQDCPWGKMENDLEYPVYMKFPILKEMKKWLLKQPEVHSSILSGSGSTMLAILRHFDGGEPLAEKAHKHFGNQTWTFCGYTN